jgi:hypothetical protein
VLDFSSYLGQNHDILLARIGEIKDRGLQVSVFTNRVQIVNGQIDDMIQQAQSVTLDVESYPNEMNLITDIRTHILSHYGIIEVMLNGDMSNEWWGKFFYAAGEFEELFNSGIISVATRTVASAIEICKERESPTPLSIFD